MRTEPRFRKTALKTGLPQEKAHPVKTLSGWAPRLRELFDFKQRVEHHPQLRKVLHNVPDRDPAQAVLVGKQQLRADRARVLEPDLVLGVVPPVIVIGRLGGFVILDERAHLDRLVDCLYVGDRPRGRFAGDIGQCPIVPLKLLLVHIGENGINC